jgi:hypothetical protein
MTRGLWSADARMTFDRGCAVPAADHSCRRRFAAEDLELVAKALGLPEAQLANELDDRSAADVALDHGVEPAIVVDALVARSMRRIARAIESGRISPEYGLEVFPRLARRSVSRVHAEPRRGSRVHLAR